MVERADLAVLPGVGSARSALEPRRPRARRRAPRPVHRGETDARDLPGAPAGSRVVGRGRRRPWTGPSAGTRRAAERAHSPHRMGACRSGRRGVLLRTLVRRGDTRRNRELRGRRRRRRVRELRRRPVPSGEERPSRRPLPGPMPLPRLIPASTSQAGASSRSPFQGLRDVGDPVELGEAYSSRGRRARLPGRLRDGSGPRHAGGARPPGGRAAGEFPSRSAAASGRSATPRRCSKPGPTRSP